MSVGKRWWQQDMLLRGLGVGLWLIAFLAIRRLLGSAHTGHEHQATLGEMGLAAIGFLGFSFGSVLTFLGAHIHDQVEIAERWRVRPADRQIVDRLSSEELLARFELRAPEVFPARSKVSIGPWREP